MTSADGRIKAPPLHISTGKYPPISHVRAGILGTPMGDALGVSSDSLDEIEVATKGYQSLSRVLPVARLPFQWSMLAAKFPDVGTPQFHLIQACFPLYIQLALELIFSPDLPLEKAIALS